MNEIKIPRENLIATGLTRTEMRQNFDLDKAGLYTLIQQCVGRGEKLVKIGETGNSILNRVYAHRSAFKKFDNGFKGELRVVKMIETYDYSPALDAKTMGYAMQNSLINYLINNYGAVRYGRKQEWLKIKISTANFRKAIDRWYEEVWLLNFSVL